MSSSGVIMMILVFMLVGLLAYAGTYVILKPIVGWALEPLEKKSEE